MHARPCSDHATHASNLRQMSRQVCSRIIDARRVQCPLRLALLDDNVEPARFARYAWSWNDEFSRVFNMARASEHPHADESRH